MNDGDVKKFRRLYASAGITPAHVSRFRNIIYSYYTSNGRDLPWRHTTDPYNILISEIMLQQTQVERVLHKYPQFIAVFPSFHDLATASLSQVLAVWQGMGYNKRAVSLQRCAKTIVQEYGGILPEEPDVLASLPGIGKATVGSILAFAFNKPTVFIETNIRRVFIYFFFDEMKTVTDSEILPLVQLMLDADNPRAWYSALMDYGSMLKTKVPNPNRRSSGYTRQAGFTGSNRQIRGTILRLLLTNPGLTSEEILSTITEDPGRVRRIIDTLAEEGFLERKKGQLFIKEVLSITVK